MPPDVDFATVSPRKASGRESDGRVLDPVAAVQGTRSKCPSKLSPYNNWNKRKCLLHPPTGCEHHPQDCLTHTCHMTDNPAEHRSNGEGRAAWREDKE